MADVVRPISALQQQPSNRERGERATEPFHVDQWMSKYIPRMAINIGGNTIEANNAMRICVYNASLSK